MPPEELLFDEKGLRVSLDSSGVSANSISRVSCVGIGDHYSPEQEEGQVASEKTGETTVTHDDDYDNDETQRRMLDYFPLDQEELLFVLKGYSKFAKTKKDDTESSFAIMFETETLATPDNNSYREMEGTLGDDDNKAIPPMDFAKQRQYAQEEFLPESGAILQQALANVFLIGSGNDTSPVYQYLEAVVTLLGRRASRGILSILFQVVAGNSNPPVADADSLISLTYRLILASAYLQFRQPTLRRMHPRSWVESLSSRCTSKVTLPAWNEWVNSVAPQIDKTLSTFSHHAIFGPHHPFRSTNPPLALPIVVDDASCALWTFPYQGIPSSLGILSPSLGGPWVQLYSSDLDGCSFRAMQEALLSYHGTTAILIQTTKGDAFGYYSNCPWKESKRWYGQYEATESFLFGLKPSLQYYGPTNSGMDGNGKPFYMYLHNPVYAHPTDLNGLAIGGINDKTARVHITTNFEHCKAGSMDSVYASGPLLSDGDLFFDIDVVEVFAVNCTPQEFEKGIREGQLNAAVREGTRVKAAKVDRKQFLEDFQSGQYINKAFAHRGQVRGRHSFTAHEDGVSGYFIDYKSPSMRRLVTDGDATKSDKDDCV